MELSDYVHTLRRRWLLIATVVLVCVAGAVALTVLAVPKYASSARLYVSTSQSESLADGYEGGLLAAQRVTSYADFVGNSRDLAEKVIAEVGADLSAEELMANVTPYVVPDTVNINITVVDPDAHQAQALAQSYADNMTEMVREIETPPGSRAAPIKMMTIDGASFSDNPVSPNPIQNVGLGLLIGLVLGVALALVRDRLDTTIKSFNDVAPATPAPLLGSIPYDSGARGRPLITDLDSHAPRVEAFRVLRTNMQFVDVDAKDKVFVVTSSLPSEGKTSTSVNLALTLAQAGQRTLLIEGDLRRPKATSALSIDNAVGITTILVGKVSLDDALVTHDDSSLDVLASGPVPPNPAELLQSKAMADLLAEVRRRYDIVIIDAPPLLPVTDAALLAAQSDGALLVVRHGRTTKDHLSQAASRLKQVDAQAVGVVLNMTPTGRRSYGYGYGYGYGYAPENATTT